MEASRREGHLRRPRSWQDVHHGTCHQRHNTHPASSLTLLGFPLQAADLKEGLAGLCRLPSGAEEEGSEAWSRGRRGAAIEKKGAWLAVLLKPSQKEEGGGSRLGGGGKRGQGSRERLGRKEEGVEFRSC